MFFDGIEDIGDFFERVELGGIFFGYEFLVIVMILVGVCKLCWVIDSYELEYELLVLLELVVDLWIYLELE